MSQRIEVPPFLLEMSQQMHEQDNRITADPIWQVRCKRYLVTEQGYNEDHWEILHDDSEGRALHHSALSDDYSELAEYLLETDEDWCKEWCEEREIEFCESAFIDTFSNDYDHDGWIDLPDGYERLYLQETDEVVKTCLTEADALAFIARKQHDYPKLYTYVASMVFCPQMIELRNWIMSLTKSEVKA